MYYFSNGEVPVYRMTVYGAADIQPHSISSPTLDEGE